MGRFGPPHERANTVSTQQIRILVPPRITAPRGAEWAARAALGLCRAIWRALETVGQRRAERELRLLAQRWEPFDPGLARELRAASRFDPTQG